MKHTFKRAMSLFMALAMVLTMVPSFGTHVHAEELETEPVVMTEEPATEAPVVEAPETEAAETEAPTQAPETEAPATEAPEIVETEAPEVTEEAPEVVETEPAEETEATEETFPEESLEEEIVEEEAVAASHALSTISGLYAEWTDASNSKGSASWSASGTGITGTATGWANTTMGMSVTTTLTLKNVSGGEAKLSFDYSLNDGSASVEDSEGNKVSVAKNTSGSYAKVLAADDAITITLTSAKAKEPRANELKLTGMSLISTSAASVATTFVPAAEGGTYSVNGVEVTAETSEETAAGTKFTLTAVAGEGYVFFGWYDMSTNTCLDYNAEYAYTASKDGAEIVAKFVSASTALFGVGAAKFYSLTEAGAFAESGDTKLIVLLNDGVVTGSHSIPAGTTLLIPFDDKNTVYTDTPVCTNTDSQHAAEWVRPTAYRTLELAAGATISVSGSISISAKHFAGGSGRNAASPTENVGFVKMGSGSQITLNSGANLYAWGFVTGSGKVIAKSGAKVYENFQVRDFRGGGATSAMATDFIVFPMTQYYVQNIEVPVTFEYGAEEHVYTSLFMSGRAYSAGVKFIGDKAMFRPEEGCKLTKDYIESRDRLQLSVEGTASLASLTLSVEGVADIDSSVFLLPINSNITIEILSGTTTLCQDVSLLPGVELTVAQGAVLNVASGKGSATIESGTGSNVFVYDADEWNYGLVWDEEIEDLVQDNTVGYVYPNTKFVALDYVPGRTYTRTTADLKDVKLDINGTLVADGFLYTTAGGANITSSEKCGVVAMNSGAGEEAFTYQAIQIDTIPVYCAIPVASAQLRNGDGTYLDTTGAKAGATFNYCQLGDHWMDTAECEEHLPGATHYEVTWIVDGVAAPDEIEKGEKPVYPGELTWTVGCVKYTIIGWRNEAGSEFKNEDLPADVEAAYTAIIAEEFVHSFTTVRGDELTAGTCMTEAVYAVKCDNCDAQNAELTVKGEKNPENHTKQNTYVEGAKEATCGEKGYTGDTVCECGEVIVKGEIIPAKQHAYAVVSYKDITETHHTAVYVCGNDASHTYDETVEHDYTYDPAAHTCICGAVETFTITWIIDGVETSVEVTFNTLPEAPVAEKAADDAFTYEFKSWDKEIVAATEDTAYTAIFTRTGWLVTEEGAQYLVKDEVQKSGWTEIGDAWYYLDPETGYRAEGVARVPYPTVTVAGNTYAPDQQAIDYAASKGVTFIDEKDGWFLFGEDGKFQSAQTGIGEYLDATRYVENGHIAWHAGMVADGEDHYYFTGDEEIGGNIMATGDVYVIRVADNCEREFSVGGIYTFGENGLLIDNHGIVDMGNGTKRYYQNAQLMAGEGLVEVPIDNNDNHAFIFVRGNGELVVNTKYWVGANDLNVVPGLYAFDENGYMINPAPADKNGVFAEDGALYFYENGKRTYKGLIEYGDGIIYVTTSGKLATGKYYVTKTDLIEGYEPGFYFFDAEGYMEITTRNGIVDGKFYVDGEVQYGAGLIEYNDGLIYVRSNGEVVMDQAYWITNTNNLLPAGCYEFDSEGYLQIDESLDGVVGLNYYIDGVKQFGNGLVQVEDGYIYVKTNGELATGTYWITRTNGLMSAGCYEFDTDGYMILG